MADVPDWLLDVGGAALGLNKGAVLAADPYKAWAEVNTRDLANERFGVQNRDIAAIQAAKENPDLNYYGNYVGAANVASQLASAKGTSDIYNTNTALDLQKVLGPGGPFQAEAKARGLTPNMPEYRRLAEEYIGRFNPQAGIAAEDLFKIPEVQNRNTMDQFNEAYVQAYARMKDPNAIAVRQVDGTFKIYGSHGEQIPVNADQLANIVSFMKGGDPAAVMRANLTTQGNIQKDNAAMVTALGNWAKNTLPKIATAADLTKAMDSVRIGRDRVVAGIDKQIADLKKGVDWSLKSPAEQQALLAPLEAKKADADAQRERAIRLLEDHADRMGLPRASVRPGTTGVVASTGQSSMTTAFNPIAQALGVTDPYQSPSYGQDLVPTGVPAAPVPSATPLPTSVPTAGGNPYRNFGAPTGGMGKVLQGIDLLTQPAANPMINFGVPRASVDPVSDLYGLGNETTAGTNPGLEQYLAALLSGQGQA